MAKKILLVGGGHAHALLVKQLSKLNTPHCITLISDGEYSPYSGVFPGVVAGHFDQDAHLIHLPSVCKQAGVQFINARVQGIDTQEGQNTITTQCNQQLLFDLVSINTGITPEHNTPGVSEHAIAIKPIHTFYEKWLALKKVAEQQPIALAVVGGGAGGVEMAFAINYALQQTRHIHQVHLFTQRPTVLNTYPCRVQKTVSNALNEANIHVHTRCKIDQVSEHAVHHAGQRTNVDATLWCTSAQAASWLKDTPLELDSKGFIRINEYLQSTSHPFIFAAGDIATHVNAPYPKAGVYAVRQAPYLLENILRAAQGHSTFMPFKPQKRFLSLLALGEQRAVASWPPLSASGKWLWHWKKHIDFTFLNQFK